MTSSLASEARIFLWYALAAFRPGAPPPEHPDPRATPRDDEVQLGNWGDQDLKAYLDEARRAVDQQQADKRDIRGRAQVVLTSSLILGGATVADFASHAHPAWWIWASYGVAFGLILLSALCAAGIITAQSPIGAPNLDYVETQADRVALAVAQGYRDIRNVGATTVALMVTALRDSTLVLVVGFVSVAIAHLLPPVACHL